MIRALIANPKFQTTLVALVVLVVTVCCVCADTNPEPDEESTPEEPTPTSVSTPAPTETPSPTETPVPTPVVRPGDALSPENITRIEQLAQIGTGEPLKVAWSPDGETFALGTGAGVFIFDGHTMEELGLLPSEYSLVTVYSPDGQMLAAGGYGDITIWNPNTNELLVTIPRTRDVKDLIFDPDSQTLLVADVKNVSSSGLPWYQVYIDTYSASTGGLIQTITFAHPEGSILIPRFVDHGEVVLTNSTDTFYWWSSTTGSLLYQHKMPQPLYSDATSSGTTAAVMSLIGTRRSLELRGLASGETLTRINAGGTINRFEFDAAGENLIILTSDGLGVWDVTTYEQVGDYPISANTDFGMAAAVSPDNQRLAGVTGQTLQLIDVAGDALLAERSGFTDRAWQVALSPDHALLALGRGTYWEGNVRLEIWDAAHMQLLYEQGGRSFENTINDLQFTPDGQMVVSGENDTKTLKYWDVKSGELADEFEAPDTIFSYAFSQDGSVLISGETHFANLWDLGSGEELDSIGYFYYGIGDVALSADASLVAICNDGSVFLWDAGAGEDLLTQEWVEAHDVDLSADGTQFVYSSGTDVLVWDTATVERLQTLAAESEIDNLALSPDGSLIVASTDDGMLHFWDTLTGELLYSMAYSTLDFGFSEDGLLLVTTSSDGTVRLWGLAQP